jgi:hypothetical protein
MSAVAVRAGAVALLRVVLAMLPAAAAADDRPLPIVDTHAHLEHLGGIGQFGAALDAAVAEMDRLGVRASVLMPPPQAKDNRFFYDIDELKVAVERYPGRFLLAAGGGTLNPAILRTPPESVDEPAKRRFREQAEQLLAQGAVGFGEITAHHLSLPAMGPMHGYSVAPADHPLLLLLADIAAERNVPIDLHFDAVPEPMPLPAPIAQNPKNPRALDANLAAFERLLAHNRNAKIVWAHAGSDPLRTRTPALCRELLMRHPNLYMSLRGGGRGVPHPSFALDEAGRLKPVWAKLIADFPDRFVLGSDRFHAAGAPRTPLLAQTLPNLRRLVDQLPAELARRVAVANVERLYGLPQGWAASIERPR